MPLVSFSGRDMDANPLTIGEFIELLSEFPKEHELRFMGANGEIFFHRFKQRDVNLQTIEFDDPATFGE